MYSTHAMTHPFCLFFYSLHRAKAEQVKITLGEYSLNSDVEPLSPVQVGVAEIHVHPYFKFTPQADRYDVAVLRLDRYVPYEPHISPICLPEKGDDFLGEYAWAAGWGAMQAGRHSIHLILTDRLYNQMICESFLVDSTGENGQIKIPNFRF